MRFEDKGLTPGNYKWAFLAAIVELAPEVMKNLKLLVPKYKQVFGAFDYHRSMQIFDFLVSEKAEDLNYILSEIDENFRHIDPHAPVPNESENTIIKNFLDFQNSFYQFVELYGLTENWLKAHFSDLLYRLADNPNLSDGILLASAHGYMPYSGGGLIFEFDGWHIEDDSKDYEKAAIRAFKKHLTEYIEKTGERAKADGYKLTRRKKEYSRVEWLVRWTVQNWTMKEISAKYDTSKGRDAIEKYEKFERKVFAAFDEFKKYELPVRLKNKHCNNLVTKNTIK